MCASQVHRSLATYLVLKPVTRYKHIRRHDLPRAIFAMPSATAEHIARILLASHLLEDLSGFIYAMLAIG
jgi:hypothetical protein